jgi:hypothetical protein
MRCKATVMNIITFDAAYSFYPNATFEERTSLWMPESQCHEQVQRILAKYSMRGWSIISDIFPHKRQLFRPGVSCHVGDKISWTIPLNTDKVRLRSPLSPTSPPFTWDPIIQNSWNLFNDSSRLYMKYAYIQSYCLKHCYIIASDVHCMVVRECLEKQEHLEKVKLYGLEGSYHPQLYTWYATTIDLCKTLLLLCC